MNSEGFFQVFSDNLSTKNNDIYCWMFSKSPIHLHRFLITNIKLSNNSD